MEPAVSTVTGLLQVTAARTVSPRRYVSPTAGAEVNLTPSIDTVPVVVNACHVFQNSSSLDQSGTVCVAVTQ